jgi:hypothetical protein
VTPLVVAALADVHSHAAEGQVLLVGCGTTSLVALKAQGLDPDAVGAVAVTTCTVTISAGCRS